jgi:hypothetical protein
MLPGLVPVPDPEGLAATLLVVVGIVLIVVPTAMLLRGYPETFSHYCHEIKQPPCGNETRGDRRERGWAA